MSLRLGILVSGRGSNLEAVLAAIADGSLRGVEPALVVSSRPGVRALSVAERHGVPALVLRRSDFDGDPAARDRAIGRALRQASVGLALLAGYDQLLRPAYFDAYGGRTINIHPSLLPRHGGPGMVGEAVHRSVLAARDAMTGVTVHEVTPELDAGPILAQVAVDVADDDDVASLADRVLEVEHRVLVETLARLAAEAAEQGSSATMPAGVRPGADAVNTNKAY